MLTLPPIPQNIQTIYQLALQKGSRSQMRRVNQLDKQMKKQQEVEMLQSNLWVIGCKQIFMRSKVNFLLLVGTTSFHKRIIIQMIKHNSPPQEAPSIDRLHLQELSLNLPSPYTSRHPTPSQPIIPPRPPLPQTSRHNKTASLKNIAQLKQILSKSLFSKKTNLAPPTSQKPKDDLIFPKSDTKPISPESQQKQPPAPQNNKMVLQPQGFQEMENEYQSSSTNQLLDMEFNRILDMNFQKGDIGLQIESKFTSIKSKTSLKQEPQPQLLEPAPANPKMDNLMAHEKLLQQQNAYIRQQLIFFTETIDTQRIKNSQLKHKYKTHHRENHKLKNKNKMLIEELEDREERCYNMALVNEEYLGCIGSLERGKGDMMEKIEDLSRECEDIFNKLQNYEQVKEKQFQTLVQEKNKEKEQLSEELLERQREIEELNQYVEMLKQQIRRLEQKNNSGEDRVNSSINQDEEMDNQRSSSICLSYAEAQSLKHIIQTKQHIFHQEIDSLKRKSIILQSQTNKQIQELNQKICSQREIQEHIEQRHREQMLKLQHQLSKKIDALQQQLKQQRNASSNLNRQLFQLQKKYKSIDAQQDEQLQDLLQNCVEQLQKQRSANSILRQEIENLKRMFAKEVYYVQQIQSNFYSAEK